MLFVAWRLDGHDVIETFEVSEEQAGRGALAEDGEGGAGLFGGLQARGVGVTGGLYAPDGMALLVALTRFESSRALGVQPRITMPSAPF